MPVLQVSQAARPPPAPSTRRSPKWWTLDGQIPRGLSCHAVAETPSGEVVIVDVWESAEASAQFARDRVFPAFAATGNDELMAQGLHRPTRRFISCGGVEPYRPQAGATCDSDRTRAGCAWVLAVPTTAMLASQIAPITG